MLVHDDLVEIKTAPSTPAAPPRPPTLTSVPSLLHVLQGEWDSTMLECLQLRREGAELRQELSHALYKEDAAMRVLARMTRERDEAREALASVKATLGPAFSTGAADVEMEVEEAVVESGLTGEARSRVVDTAAALSATRKKRKVAPEYVKAAELKEFAQTAGSLPSFHTTKPPGVSALVLGRDGSLIVTGGLDKNVQVYDRATSKILGSLKGHIKKVTAVLASPSLNADSLPSFIVSASLDKSVRVWSPNGSKTTYGMSSNLPTGGEVNSIDLHPSGSLVGSASSDGSWSIHDVSTAKATTLLTVSLPSDVAEGTANTAIAFHPDGAIVAIGSSDSFVRIFDVLTGAVAATFTGHSEANGGAITSLSFSENGYTLASSAASSNQVKIWDLRKLTNSHSITLSEGCVVHCIKFDTSANFLAVAGTDLRVFANKTWEELLVSDDNAAELTSVAWGKEGREVVVAGIDRTVRFVAAKE